MDRSKDALETAKEVTQGVLRSGQTAMIAQGGQKKDGHSSISSIKGVVFPDSRQVAVEWK
jgi:hypothetical protein